MIIYIPYMRCVVFAMNINVRLPKLSYNSKRYNFTINPANAFPFVCDDSLQYNRCFFYINIIITTFFMYLIGLFFYKIYSTNFRLFLAMSYEIYGAPPSCQKLDGINNNRLTCPCFSGEDSKPLLK